MPQDVLAAAAKHLGYKVVPDVAESDDKFDDDEKKALKAQVKKLSPTAAFGPDAPQNVAIEQVMRTIRAFEAETEAGGNLKHPLHAKYSAEMAGKVREFRAANGDKMPTKDDLSRFYSEVAPAIVAPSAAPVKTSAAQTTQSTFETTTQMLHLHRR